MRSTLMIFALVVGCASDANELPTPSELYGHWISTSEPGKTHEFEFAAMGIAGHPELAGMRDVYVYTENAEVKHTGRFKVVDLVDPPGALTFEPVSGTNAEGTDGTYIFGWTGTTLTMWNEYAPRGEWVFARQ
jgi:hypothetical protein